MSNSSDPPAKSRPTTSLTKGLQSVFQGRVGFGQATLEAFRRGRAAVQSRRERAMLDELAAQPARLCPEFLGLSPTDLLKHFRSRAQPSFFPGFELAESTASRQRDLFPDETERLIESARRMVATHRWQLLGFGEREFGAQINWHRDPPSGRVWPLDYHADIPLWHDDGSDIRVLWEFNRLGHLLTLGQTYALTREEGFAAEFFAQVESWRQQNPVGRGANWACAMEVALRAMNLLAAFSLFRSSTQVTEERLRMLLTLLDQHGAHIRRNLEFSHVATSNHYLSDIAGLLWLAIMLPELRAAEEWRAWALKEMLREMDKQILPDGADYEGSTGYHCFVLELFLYSFLLCRSNGIPIEDKYWRKLHLMLEYLRAILRPDGFIPLVGDTDGGQVLPLTGRSANDRAYLLALGAVVLNDSSFKLRGLEPASELLWLLGAEGVQNYQQLADSNAQPSSQAFPDAGTYALRHEDLYLSFNACGSEKGRPVSHRHNDLLSIEVSAGGRAFIIDPGSYVYTADLHERHLFRSTAYHSTVQVDDEEQQTIIEEAPFAVGGQAAARAWVWESTAERDRVGAEHSGYEHQHEPVTHRRVIVFNKPERGWLIEDELVGKGRHKIATRFHFDAGLDVRLSDSNSVIAGDESSGVSLVVRSLDLDQPAELEAQFTSRQYGSKVESVAACWTTNTSVPCKLRWSIVPIRAGENLEERIGVVQSSKVQGPKFVGPADFGL